MIGKKNISGNLNIIVAITIAALFLYLQFHDLENNDSENPKKQLVLGEQSTSNGGTASFASENYKITDITLDGELKAGIDNESGNIALDIFNVKNEIYTPKDKDDNRILLSWNTNKSARSDITYMKKGETISRMIKEKEYSLVHSLVISNLDADSVYSYKIKSFDKWGNNKESDEYVFYTGAPNVSIVDVLGNAVSKLFGWAITRK